MHVALEFSMHAPTAYSALAHTPASLFSCACEQEEVCKEQVEWAKTEKRTFLRQRIELRLASLALDTKNFADSLSIIGR